MADIVVTVVAKLSELLVEPTINEFRYCFSSSDITQGFEDQQELLKTKLESVQNHVKEALNNTEIPEKEAEKWVGEAEKLIKMVDDIKRQRRGVRERCSTFGWRKHHINKQMSKKTSKMRQLCNDCKFEVISHPAPLLGPEYFSSGSFRYFGSTKLAYQKLLEAIKDENTFMVGLYGMGGSGKTTLIKELGRKVHKEFNLFEYVVFTTISQTPNVRRIQDEIADLLGLRLIEQSEAGRARRVTMRLQSGDRILLILDDVWAKLNLEEIGIPLKENHQGCKVLLTTRLQRLCRSMNCEKSIPLELLSEEESWGFFQLHAGIIDKKPSWLSEDLARNITRECKGLPIAIEAVGTTLKEKSCDEWNVALYQLKNSKPMDLDEGVRDSFTCLKLSYDYLRNSEAKSLFLMCGLFPEDHDISEEDLFRYGMGLGLCKDVEQLEIARSKVKVGINHLMESCLLTRSEKGNNYLKMHDIVRDVALWITSKEYGSIKPNEEALNNDCYAISSWYKEGNHYNLPQDFEALNLEVLLINTRSSLDLSHASFQRMKMLKVVGIINENYDNKLLVSLPQIMDSSSQVLPLIQTLRLVGLKLDDISFISTLKSLEILDLRASCFKELPSGIIQLKRLRLLDLSWCDLDEDCYKVIAQCKQLQEMYLLKDPRFI